MKQMVTYGEAMLRLTAPVGVPLETASAFAAPVGGAELNVAIAARRQGAHVRWVSTLPEGPLGDLVARHAAAHGVEGVLRRTPQGRLGLYFLEQATPPRASRILYDREDTAFVRRPRPKMEWSELLDSDSVLVVSGITPALGADAREAVEEALDVAREVGAMVAVDVNYRASLWSLEDAFAWLKGIIDRVDVLSASRHDLAHLGVETDDPHRQAVTQLGLAATVGTSKQIRGRTATVVVHAATADGMTETEVTAEILDPVGAGDALFGTFLAGLDRLSLEQNTARAAGALVTAYGVVGDALTADPWTPADSGGLRR